MVSVKTKEYARKKGLTAFDSGGYQYLSGWSDKRGKHVQGIFSSEKKLLKQLDLE